MTDFAPEYKWETIILYLRKYGTKEEFKKLVLTVFYKIFKFYSDVGAMNAATLERQLVLSSEK